MGGATGRFQETRPECSWGHPAAPKPTRLSHVRRATHRLNKLATGRFLAMGGSTVLANAVAGIDNREII